MKVMKATFSTAKRVVTIMQVFIIFIAIGLPVFLKDYINPAFEGIIIQHVEDEASRVAKRIKLIIIRKEDTPTFGLTHQFSLTAGSIAYLKQAVNDFNLWKIKIYDHTGKVMYSTIESEIGSMHTKSYFPKIIAKGNPYTETEYITLGTGENSKEHYFMESYIPIMLEGGFFGAFELYYDVTERKKALDNLISKIYHLVLIVSVISIILAISSGIILMRFRTMRDNYELQLFDLATNDKLTQLLNRHSIESSLQLCINQYQQNKIEYSFILLDVDHFKNVNDNYGHTVGDEVLFNLATLIKDRLRDNDIIGRFGGEEFVAILPNTNVSGGKAVAEHLRKMVENTPIKTSSGEIKLTISLGVGNFADIKDLSWKTIITKVDEALYKSKHNGRNQVTYVEK